MLTEQVPGGGGMVVQACFNCNCACGRDGRGGRGGLVRMHTHTRKPQEKRDPRGAGWRTHALPPPTHGNLHAIGALTHPGGAAARIMQCIVCGCTRGGRGLRCNVCILGHMAQHVLAQVSVLGPCAATQGGAGGSSLCLRGFCLL